MLGTKAACDRMARRWKGKLFQFIKELFLSHSKEFGLKSKLGIKMSFASYNNQSKKKKR